MDDKKLVSVLEELKSKGRDMTPRKAPVALGTEGMLAERRWSLLQL